MGLGTFPVEIQGPLGNGICTTFKLIWSKRGQRV